MERNEKCPYCNQKTAELVKTTVYVNCMRTTYDWGDPELAAILSEEGIDLRYPSPRAIVSNNYKCPGCAREWSNRI